jgi:type 1 fimbria pilin
MNLIPKTPRRFRGCLRGVLFVIMMLSALALPALAQDAGFGTISGTVTDPNHSVVTGATVTVIQSDTGIKRDLQTSSTGGYSATFLKPGRYEVLVAAGGFAKVDRKDITVPVGQILTIDVELPVASAESTVTITGDAPLIDTEKIGTSQEIGPTML